MATTVPLWGAKNYGWKVGVVNSALLLQHISRQELALKLASLVQK